MSITGFLLIGATFFGGDQGERLPEPPAMPRRAIAPRPDTAGMIREIEDGDRKYSYFLPESAKRTSDAVLTIHFHSAQWHAVQEHIDRGIDGPLIALYAGEGSSVYAKSFDDPERLNRWMAWVVDDLKAKGWPADTRIAGLNFTSFSAGYGAVRVLLQKPEVFKLVRRVILADSMYGSLTPDVEARVPLAAHVEVWKPLADAAIAGSKTFVVTYSQVPTPTYASSSEMGSALVKLAGGTTAIVAKGILKATEDPEFPLLARFDRGNFHVWSYGGEDAQAHMTHARHLSDIWKALDKSKAP